MRICSWPMCKGICLLMFARRCIAVFSETFSFNKSSIRKSNLLAQSNKEGSVSCSELHDKIVDGPVEGDLAGCWASDLRMASPTSSSSTLDKRPNTTPKKLKLSEGTNETGGERMLDPKEKSLILELVNSGSGSIEELEEELE